MSRSKRYVITDGPSVSDPCWLIPAWEINAEKEWHDQNPDEALEKILQLYIRAKTSGAADLARQKAHQEICQAFRVKNIEEVFGIANTRIYG